MKRSAFILILIAILCAPVTIVRAQSSESLDDHWPQWRGPHLNGAAIHANTPAEWGEGKNIKWKVATPGKGHSTPIIWGNKIFITAAVPEAPGSESLNYDVLCYSRADGKLLWQKTANKGVPHEGYHRQYGSFASGSCVTDGSHVWAFFGSRGLYCYDMDGNQKWAKDFGVKMRMRNGFGEGTSPALHGDTLVLHFDNEGDNSFIAALDKNTGKEIWRQDRDEVSSWSTPKIMEVGDRTEVILPATNFVTSYDLKTGEVIWKCKGLGSNVIPIPIVAHGNVIVMSGHRNPALFAIELGKTGDLTGSDAVKWRLDRGMPYTPCAVLHNDIMYIADRNTLMTAIDTKTGKTLYQTARLPSPQTIKASPTASKDKIYIACESGDVVVIKPGPQLEVIATNKHDEFFVASPAIAGNELFLRGDKHLYCIAE
jgi:outer membrane protein assembly factor BamB